MKLFLAIPVNKVGGARGGENGRLDVKSFELTLSLELKLVCKRLLRELFVSFFDGRGPFGIAVFYMAIFRHL